MDFAKYETTLKRISELMHTNDAEELKELIALADEVVDYEDAHYPVGGPEELSHIERYIANLLSRIEERDMELADICKRLRGIPGPDGSRLDGEWGLAAATIRAVDWYEKERTALKERVRGVAGKLRRVISPQLVSHIYCQQLATELEDIAKR